MNMELCGLHTSTNTHTLTHTHTHLQEWNHQTSGGHVPQKRRRSDDPNLSGDRRYCTSVHPDKERVKSHSRFIQIDGQRGVYYSESWEPNGSTLYLPVRGIVLANMHKYDQVSLEQGCFCIGDDSGGFRQRVQGQALHCWRYSQVDRKLFVALSYFFTNSEVFQEVLSSLECL